MWYKIEITWWDDSKESAYQEISPNGEVIRTVFVKRIPILTISAEGELIGKTDLFWEVYPGGMTDAADTHVRLLYQEYPGTPGTVCTHMNVPA